MVAVFTMHGAVFSAVRLPRELRVRAAGAAVLAAIRFAKWRRDGREFARTAVAVLTPLVATGAASAPRLLDGAAGVTRLELLAAMAFPVIPVLVAVQARRWWLIRQRMSTGSAVFF